MKHFVEVETRRVDGVLVVQRIAMRSNHEAQGYVGGLAKDMFGLKTAWHLNSFKATNDFGEPVLIQAKAYGPKAQVKEGMYTL